MEDKDLEKEAESYAQGYADVGYDEDQIASVRDAFIDGAKWADQHPAWISVDERKPNDGQVVLIYSKGGDVCVTCYKNGAFNCSPLFQAINVTHWMEIIPPQGKEE